jgi:F0F1-type ATP synthase assembly protein I
MPVTPTDPDLEPSPDPSPERENSGRKQNVWVQVARYSQLALVLPSATVVGWLLGAALDRWLHTKWISILGLLLGTAGGLIEVIRTILRDTK